MIESIVLKNVRNHEQAAVDFSHAANLLYGPNGAGKTSILEAIYCMYRGSSFKGSDRDLVRNGSAWFSIELRDDEGVRRMTYDARGERATKKFIIDDKTYARLPAKYKRPIVLFSPDDLLLLTGSPSRRRRYIDTMIAQINPSYATVLRKYERALVQRNKLLKSSECTPDTLFSWNVLLSEYGAQIINARIDAITYIDSKATDYYQAIARTADIIRITYSSGRVTPQSLLQRINEHYMRDSLLGVTTIGPHRHDVEISMNHTLAVATASRGENRTIILAFKQLEIDYITQVTRHRPLVLLDDVLGELDDERQLKTLAEFKGFQTIITSTHELTEDPIKAIHVSLDETNR